MVELKLLEKKDREQFIKENQYAFKYGAMEEFGLRDNHFEEDGEIISRKTIEDSIDGGIAYRIVFDGKNVGGLVLKIDNDYGELELLFINPLYHNKGIGYDAWCEIEKMYPNVKTWETCTPYFEIRNIHFYINKCGFHAIEFYCKYHQDPHEEDIEDDEMDGMFRFIKKID